MVGVLNFGLVLLLALRRKKEDEVLSHIEHKYPSGVYTIWNKHVSDIQKQVGVLNIAKQMEMIWVLIWPPLELGIDLEEMINRAVNEVIKLLRDCPKEILVYLPSIEEYPTLQKAFQDIQTKLQSVKCAALGDRREPSETTLIMQHLNNHFCASPDFDVVIFIKLLADDEQTDLHILQKIADRIKVDREGCKSEVAGRIQKVLENKRYLLILDGLRKPSDGIWEKLDCKVAMNISEWHWLCDNAVRKLERLSRSEAWKMFRDTGGHNHLPPTAKPASPLEGESSSKSSTDAIGKPLLDQDVTRLMRIRDFVHLMLSYPMRIGYEEFMKQWINDVHELSFADDSDFDSFWRKVERLLYDESPLRYVQAVIPQDITKEIIKGGSVSRETALKHVPEPILLLATDLALHQLTLTLTSDTIHYGQLALENIQTIWFSTRNDEEKGTVVQAVKANPQIRAAFKVLEIIDLNRINDETKRELVLINLSEKYWWPQCRTLVVVVDRDGDKKVDPLRVSLPMHESKNVLVFITTQSPNDYLTSNVDLTIKTEDHLLPWELFCNIAGSELLHSPSDIQEIAVQIVKKCGGHLLAIILMAKSLKHVKDIQHWESALEKLRDRGREAIVNALIFNIWANEMSVREKARLIRCLMVFRFQDYWKMSDDQLFARWFSQQLVDTKEEATSILQNFMERYVLLQFEDTQGRHILLPEDIKLIFHSIREKIPENLSEGALVMRGEREWWKKLQWSEAERGQQDRPHKFNQIFSPFDEDLDILTQLTPYEVMTSFNTESYSVGIEVLIVACAWDSAEDVTSLFQIPHKTVVFVLLCILNYVL